jgi:hypothetical protein
VSLEFTSDGVASTTVGLTAMHNNNGTEKIIGFDNVAVTLLQPSSIGESCIASPLRPTAVYDLLGRRQDNTPTTQKGIHVVGGKKIAK